MSTTTEKPPIEPAKPEHHDEFAGAFGFFRKYQKLILYTAGIFALITFSISSSMTSWMRGLTGGPSGPQPTIQVMGATVHLEVEDQTIGSQLARHLRALPPSVLPAFMVGSDTNDLPTRFAILRRAAIAAGVDVSMAEVDAAIDWMVRAINNQNKTSDTPTQAALQRGLNSLAEYRAVVKEGLRIGNYVMLHSIGVDDADAAVMTKLLEREGHEKLTMRVATFDMKALEATLAAKGDVTEDDVRRWMEAKTDGEKTRLEVFDTNKVSLVLGIARFKDFDPEQWKDELSAFAFGDEVQKKLYKQEIDRWKDGSGKARPMDEAPVAAELKTLAQVDEVLNKLLAKIRAAQQDLLKPLQEAQQKAVIDKSERQQVRDAAKAASAAAPEDKELAEKFRLAEEAMPAMEVALKAATDALDAARKNFDFRGKFAELTKDKKGFEVREVVGPKNAKELKDLASVELGEWKLPELATGLRTAGELGGSPARAKDGAFLLQTTEVIVRPMRPWDELKANLQTKYFEEQARKVGDEKKKVFEDELLRLAKEKLPEAMAAIEAKRQPEIDKLFAEWEQKLTADLAKANEKLVGLGVGTQAQVAWQKKRDTLQAELDGREKKLESIKKEVNDRFDGEAKTEAKKKYGEVLESAAPTAGFAIAPLGPYRRDLRDHRSDPFFKKSYDSAVVFLWGGIVNDLKVGECTAVTEDTTERRYQLAVCDTVEKLTANDVSRREFETAKRNFGLMQVTTAMRQSFSMDALRKRYSFVEPEGRQIAGK